METAMSKILIVEDDRSIVDLLSINLQEENHELHQAYDGKEGLALAQKGGFDLIILDLMLPHLSGLEVCKTLRSEKNFTPVLMLTAKSEEADIVSGLEVGADDYMTKPFSIRELVARTKAILRRNAAKESIKEKPILRFGILQIFPEERKVTLSDKRIDLTPKEFDLLLLFAKNPGKTYSRERILNAVWGYDFDGFEHTVNSHMNRLRAKIEIDIANPTYILTTWGVGYRFTEEF